MCMHQQNDGIYAILNNEKLHNMACCNLPNYHMFMCTMQHRTWGWLCLTILTIN